MSSTFQNMAHDPKDVTNAIVILTLSTQLTIMNGQLLHYIRQNEILGEEVKRYQWEKETANLASFGFVPAAFFASYFFGGSHRCA